jgi:hypothetical protein
MRLMTLSCVAVLALVAGHSNSSASPLAQTHGVTTAAPVGIQLAQSDDDRRRDRSRRGNRDSRSGGGDGVYTGGRGGDGVYTGGRSRSGGDGVHTGGRGGDGVYTGGRSSGGDGVYTGGRRNRDSNSRNRGDGVYTGGRSGRGDGVYRGNRGGNQGTVFCNPELGCVRDLNMTPGAGLGGR